MGFTLLLAFFYFIIASVSGDQTVDYFTVCSEPFRCGTKANLSYPFWAAGTRPLECGHPDFQLFECGGGTNQDPILIRTESLQLRLLVVDQHSKTLTVTLRDLWKNTCTPIYGNDALNTSLLEFTPPPSHAALQFLTLFYGCSVGMTLETRVECPIPGGLPLYYANETFLRENGTEGPPGSCKGRVVFPIPEDVPDGIWGKKGGTELQQVLDAGFNMSYNYGVVYDAWCEQCRQSGGLCGTAATGSPNFNFTCHCSIAGSQLLSCPASAGMDPNVPVKVAIGVGTAVGSAVIMLILFLIYLRHRRKQQYSDTTSSLSKAILSYPSSKLELEKATSKYFGVQVFTYAELDEATNNFDSANELGDGGFGTVYYGKLKDGRAVAVKRLYETNYRRVEQFMNEIEILTRLRHPNLVSLYGCTSRHSRELLLVYEYIPNGTVADHLHGQKARSPGALPWSTRMSIAMDTASALAYLHASEIIHRDVKTNNILLDENFVVKVADFGLSRLFPNDVTHVSTAPQGTPGYVDPEYHQCYQLTSRSDVFSFGVVLVELISSMPAVDITRHRHEINLSNMAINKIQGDALHELVDQSLGFQSDTSIRMMMTAVAELAFQCLQSDKDLRPSMDQVVSTLQGIQRVGDDDSDDGVLLKSVLVQHLPPSPNSVTRKWSSVSTTPNQTPVAEASSL